jgi:hypothetical protein
MADKDANIQTARLQSAIVDDVLDQTEFITSDKCRNCASWVRSTWSPGQCRERNLIVGGDAIACDFFERR